MNAPPTMPAVASTIRRGRESSARRPPAPARATTAPPGRRKPRKMVFSIRAPAKVRK